MAMAFVEPFEKIQQEPLVAPRPHPYENSYTRRLRESRAPYSFMAADRCW